MKKILLASTLKPLDDTRMFEKFGLSLSRFYKVIILGFGNSIPENRASIIFNTLYNGNSKSLVRFLSIFTFYKKLLIHKPDIVIVHSPELLISAGVFTIFYRKKTIYDVRENYYFNIKYQSNFNVISRFLLSVSVRLIEYCSNLFIDCYILAEKCYDRELSFHKKKYIVLENKFILPQNVYFESLANKKTEFKFIFTGTISKVYGIWEAIDFIDKIQLYESEATLEIVGHVVSNNLLLELQNNIKDKPYIQLNADNSLVPHKLIIEKLLASDFAILSYQPNRSTKKCIPTKMYECISLKIPMIIQKNDYWKTLCNKYMAAYFLDFNEFNPAIILEEIKKFDFYTNKAKEEVLWVEEEKKLLNLISEL